MARMQIHPSVQIGIWRCVALTFFVAAAIAASLWLPRADAQAKTRVGIMSVWFLVDRWLKHRLRKYLAEDQ